MDPISALSLASNIVSFVDFSTRIILTAWEVYKSPQGALGERQELECVAHDLQATLRVLETSRKKGADPTLDALIGHCLALTDELLGILEKLQVKRKGSRVIQSFMVSARTRLKMSDIQDLERRITRIRDQVCARLGLLLKDGALGLSDIPGTKASNGSSSLRAALSTLERDVSEAYVKVDLVTIAVPTGVAPPPEVRERRALERKRVRGHDYFEERDRDYFEPKDLENLAKTIHFLHQKVRDFDQDQQVVKSLHFPQIQDRKAEIVDAHINTFEWIFDEASTVNFSQWAESGHGIYWISGKAGSGKSTLVKFLAAHPKTAALLRAWASGKSTVIATHFFWNAGTALQKSQEGLLRTLLFELLIECPSLIRRLCPRRWADQSLTHLEAWSRSELLDCFKQLAAANDLPAKFCLFVDGLDEYSGDHAELIRALRLLVGSSNVKICTSSRPWVDFLDAFGSSSWQLQVHTMTERDIKTFVTDRLEQDPSFRKRRVTDPEGASLLAQTISSRSQGVFLWVHLVVKSLLRGLANEDGFPILQRRLQELPDELHEYFRRMLQSIEDIYKRQTARVLQLVTYSNSAIPLVTFLFFDLDGIGRFPDSQPLLKGWPDFEAEEAELFRVKKRQLMVQCRDLLHITVNPLEVVFLGEKVVPLHRTVVDFLRTEDISQLLSQRAGAGFEPWSALLKANIEQLKSLVHLTRLSHLYPYLQMWFSNVMEYAAHGEASTQNTETVALNSLEAALATEFGKHHRALGNGVKAILNGPECRCFLDLSLHHKLHIYAREKVKLCSDADKARLLECALGGRVCVGIESEPRETPNMKALEHLLAIGVSPNIELPGKGCSVWAHYVTSCSVTLDACKVLVCHGAARTVRFQHCTLKSNSQPLSNDLQGPAEYLERDVLQILATRKPFLPDGLELLFPDAHFSQTIFPTTGGKRQGTESLWKRFSKVFL